MTDGSYADERVVGLDRHQGSAPPTHSSDTASALYYANVALGE